MGEAAVNCNPLDNSRPLDVLLFSNHRQFKSAVNRIIDEVRGDLGRGFKDDQKTYKQHLKLVILNLFESWYELPEQYVGYSRRKENYKPGTRLHKLFIRYAPLKNCIDALVKHGYVENWNGFKDRETGVGRQSRMRATPKLITAMTLHRFEFQMIERAKDDPIILRDNDHREIEFKVNSTIERKRASVNKINKFLQQQEITFEPPPHIIQAMVRGNIQKPKMKNDELVRIFNGSFEEGGRFYRHWVQGLPARLKLSNGKEMNTRQYVRIYGSSVTELDFDCIHPYILYAKQGLPLPDGDAYTLDGMQEGNKRQRDICKKILLCIFNAKPGKSPAWSIIGALHEDGIFPIKGEVPELIKELKKKHEPIKQYFASGIGRELQRVDSDIAERIMTKMMNQGVPCLPVHDSFVVPEESREALREAMIQEAQAVTGQPPRVSMKY